MKNITEKIYPSITINHVANAKGWIRYITASHITCTFLTHVKCVKRKHGLPHLNECFLLLNLAR